MRLLACGAKRNFENSSKWSSKDEIRKKNRENYTKRRRGEGVRRNWKWRRKWIKKKAKIRKQENRRRRWREEVGGEEQWRE